MFVAADTATDNSDANRANCAFDTESVIAIA
jgi:hypothetical protein